MRYTIHVLIKQIFNQPITGRQLTLAMLLHGHDDLLKFQPEWGGFQELLIFWDFPTPWIYREWCEKENILWEKTPVES